MKAVLPCLSAFALALAAAPAACAANPSPTPPMGWNSWDAYGFTIDEAQFRANVARLVRLRPYGWTYAVIDEGWYMGNPFGDRLETRAYRIDAGGQLQPDVRRFPSVADGHGFRALAAWVHAQGLKFGIHIVRGIPKQAVTADLPIAGSGFRAADAADRSETCPWDDGNFGVRDNEAGQAWYDAMIRTYADWGVDFLKVDCIADHPYRASEIRQIARAIRKTGRPIVLSLSPGPTQLSHADEVAQEAQMWRIMDDLWDGWSFAPGKWPNGVRQAMDALAAWSPHVRPGNWPDSDMLPVGSLMPHPGWGDPRVSRLSADEARTLFTLEAIARSPLILGGNLTLRDAVLDDLVTRRAIIALDQRAGRGHPVAALPAGMEQARVWLSTPEGARRPDTVAVFNLGDKVLKVDAAWRDLGLPAGAYAARELWTGTRLARAAAVGFTVPAHGVALWRVR